jgi:hypothetical protein
VLPTPEPGLRQDNLGKEDRCKGIQLETFRRNPVGKQSHPVELASSRKRVLRRMVGQPTRRSVDSQCQSRANEPREQYPREPLTCLDPGAAPIRPAILAWRLRSRRGRRTRHRYTRVPQELGTPQGSTSIYVGAEGQPNPKVPGPQPALPGLMGANTGSAGVVSPSEAQPSAAKWSLGIRSVSWYR